MTKTITKTVTVKVQPCACSRLEVVGIDDPKTIPAKKRHWLIDGTLSTDCEATTQGTFAPGHDARTAGLLQIAHRNGLKVSVDGKAPVAAMTAADRLGLSDGLKAKIGYEVKPKAKKQTAKADKK